MKKSKLDWNDATPDEAEEAARLTPCRMLTVSDGVVCSAAVLPDGLSIAAGLDDYAAGCAAGDVQGEIEVTFTLFEPGRKPGDMLATSGRWSFLKRRAKG